MHDFSDDLGALRQRLNEAHAYLKIDAARARVGELEVEISKPDLWDDQERARAANAEYAGAARRPRDVRRPFSPPRGR